MHKAYFGGKQANCANFSKGNLLRQDKYQCPREANLKKQKLITSLLQTIVEGQWRVDKSNSVVFFQLLQRFTKRLTIQGMRPVRKRKILLSFSS